MKISRCIQQSKALVQNHVEGAMKWQLYGDEISFVVFVFMRALVSYNIVSLCATEVLFTLLK